MTQAQMIWVPAATGTTKCPRPAIEIDLGNGTYAYISATLDDNEKSASTRAMMARAGTLYVFKSDMERDGTPMKESIVMADLVEVRNRKIKRARPEYYKLSDEQTTEILRVVAAYARRYENDLLPAGYDAPQPFVGRIIRRGRKSK